MSLILKTSMWAFGELQSLYYELLGAGERLPMQGMVRVHSSYMCLYNYVGSIHTFPFGGQGSVSLLMLLF